MKILNSLLTTILTIILVITIISTSVYAIELQEIKFNQNLTISTWEDVTFTATNTITLYIPPGVIGNVVVKVIATNPGSSDAGIKVNADCLNKPSTEFTVPAGSSASSDLTFEIPTIPTSYIICTITANVTNLTGIGIKSMNVPIEIIEKYNETHVILQYKLFTIPYLEIGSSINYFTKWLIDIVIGTPASGYTLTTLLNATGIASFSDSKITLNSIKVLTDRIRLNITDTYPYTGRYLGDVNVTLTINQKTLNLIIHPVQDVKINSATWIEPKSTQVEVIDGANVSIAILKAPAKVYDSTGTAYKINFTISKIVHTLNLVNIKLIEKYVNGYNLTYLTTLIPKNETEIAILALINTSKYWYEPAYVKIKFITRPLNVTFNPIEVIGNVTGFPKLEFKLINNKKLIDGKYIKINVVSSGKVVHTFKIECAYIATVTASTKNKYINVTSTYPIKDVDIVTDTTKDIPFINITLLGYYGKPFDDIHMVFFIPGADTSDMSISYTKIVPIEVQLKVEVYKFGVDNVHIYVLTDKKPNGVYRSVKVPIGIGSTTVMQGIYKLTMPVSSFNATLWTVDVNALIDVYVKFADGNVAKGVYVDLYQDSTKILSTVTDELGKVSIDPYYGSYKVEAWMLYKGSKVSVSQLFVLDNDKSFTLTLRIAKPIPEVQSVSLAIPSKVEVNKTVMASVEVVVAPIPENPITFIGTLTCSGPNVISKKFNITLLTGQSKSSIAIPLVFPKEGTYTCIASVNNIASPTVIVEVYKPAPAILFPELSPLANYLILAFAIVLLILLVIIAYRLLKPREKVHFVKW